MDTLFTALGTASLLAIFVSFVLMLIRKYRSRGVRVFKWSAAVCFGALVGSTVVDPPEHTASTADTGAITRDAESGAETARTSKGGDGEAPVTQAPEVDLAGFPSIAIRDHARSLGVKRYAAYRQLTNADAISAYCVLEDQGWAITQAKNAQIDAGGNEAALASKAEADYLSLLDQYNVQFGLIDHEAMTLSSAGYWMQYCSGFEKGWAVVNHANLTSVARKQAKRAQAVLKAIYEDQLMNGSVARNVFDPKGVGFVTCKREAVSDMWFIQCQAKGYSLNSPLHYYAVAWHQGKDYPLFVALNGKTSATWDKIAAIAQRRIDMEFSPAAYAGPRLPISEVQVEFE
ncbi:hypothetical protein PhaeoP48_00497 [Phaeobacter inhibens]|uniref:hypothetical protein n=1 Tax=Phaeobacter inhibens TaxID=221822 RepID=UPI000C9CF604|nr:hypothetical protein [Phaeobacter inhibens]AUR10510.1 hypothetical protein PhaeoP48_00497 [Phaeobacter inhibens]